jgi:hypothetical protein
MSCGLTPEELFILNALYHHRCIGINHSKNLKEIEKAFNNQFNESLEEYFTNLVNNGYIAQKRKRDIKYYIADLPKTSYVINLHGGTATEGRVYPRNRRVRLP